MSAFFYTRMMEIGNWIGGDQYSGRLIQFANAQVFGASVFNYTRNFAYIGDEIKLPVTYAKKRRAANSYIFNEIFRQIRERKDIDIGSSTMNLTIQQANPEPGETQERNVA